jgi:hypothetical protein
VKLTLPESCSMSRAWRCEVSVSFKDKTAIVSYDDGKATVEALTAATTKAGYPSTPKSWRGRVRVQETS